MRAMRAWKEGERSRGVPPCDELSRFRGLDPAGAGFSVGLRVGRNWRLDLEGNEDEMEDGRLRTEGACDDRVVAKRVGRG